MNNKNKKLEMIIKIENIWGMQTSLQPSIQVADFYCMHHDGLWWLMIL